jgi:hypothetical protein
VVLAEGGVEGMREVVEFVGTKVVAEADCLEFYDMALSAEADLGRRIGLYEAMLNTNSVSNNAGLKGGDLEGVGERGTDGRGWIDD